MVWGLMTREMEIHARFFSQYDGSGGIIQAIKGCWADGPTHLKEVPSLLYGFTVATLCAMKKNIKPNAVYAKIDEKVII